MIYLDNGATTPICDEAKNETIRVFDTFGNPSSIYELGIEARNLVKKAQRQIETALCAENDTFFFTSGATEANNWAIFGAAGRFRNVQKKIITTKTEHPSVLEPFKLLEKRGFDVSYISVDNRGNVNLEELYSEIDTDTLLVSMMNVNNETGNISDVASIGRKLKQINKSVLFHVDAVAAFCKIPINVSAANIDLLSASGHKIHAPKGIGGLYVRKGVTIEPLIYGGGQQKNMRSGTENTSSIAAFAASVKKLNTEMDANHEKVFALKKRMQDAIKTFDCAEIIGETDEGKSSPYVICAGFKGYKSQIIINALSEQGIYVSAGSACSSNKKIRNESLSALGLSDELIDGAIRFSFSRYNELSEIDNCAEKLGDILKKYKGLKR